jgi:hypothetical protein
MRKTFGVLLLAAWAAASWALPAEWVVLSPRQVMPAEEEGLYFLGPAPGGFLYNGSEEGLAAVAPYRLLDREATTKDYYLVWLTEGALVSAAALRTLGTVAPLSEAEYLVGVPPRVVAADFREVERCLELVKLAAVTPLDRRLDAESPPTQKDPDVEAALATVTALEYSEYIQDLQDFVTRYTLVPGYTAARDYLKMFFEAQGLQVTLFPFDYRGNTYHNVVAERTGNVSPDEIVIICGHLDCTSERANRETLAPGAEDNASGVAVAMAAARAFKDFEFGRTVRYIGFGGEEQGLYGSRAYALYCRNNNQDLIAVMNADMVAYDEESGNRDDYTVSHGANPWLLTYLDAVDELYGYNLIFDNQEFNGSDHYYFWAYGYAAMAAIEGRIGPGGGTMYPWYHTTEDTLDKLHPDLAVRFARDYGAMFAHLAGARLTGIEEGPGHARGGVPRSRTAVNVYPNPYRYGAAALRFEGVSSPATVTVYDLAGRRVASWEVAAGTDSCTWEPAAADGGPLAAGVYIYRLVGREQEETGKIAITR